MKLFAALSAAIIAMVMLASPASAQEEYPVPPIDWDATPVPFTPFWYVGGPGGDNYSVATASYPEEGRRLCEFFRHWDHPNDPGWSCWVIPLSSEYTFGPDGLVTSPDGPPAIDIVIG